METRSGWKEYIYGSIIVALLVLADQFTKWLAIRELMGQDAFVVWKGVFELQYLENRGAAFGVFQNQKVFFIIMTVLTLILIGYFYRLTPVSRKYLPLRLCILFIAAGALGNFIDRVFRGFVVDFFYFSLIDFPIFNVADIYLTVTIGVLAVLILFYYKEEDFKVYSRKAEE